MLVALNKSCCTVVLAGWGYSARIAQLCDQGSWNEGDNATPCKPCPLGKTTSGVGAGKKQSDCMPAPGYGAEGLCSIGETGAIHVASMCVMSCGNALPLCSWILHKETALSCLCQQTPFCCQQGRPACSRCLAGLC